MKTNTNTNEEWRPIEGFPRYEISNQGRIKSHTNPKKEKILRPHKTNSGYLLVTLVKGEAWGNGEAETVRVHKLVADAFIPNPLNRCHIRHINSLRDDNRVENLSWTTPEESANDPLTKANRMAAVPQRLEKISKPVLVYDENLTLLSAFTASAEAARQLNLSQGNIVNCCSGSLKRYKNLIFSYAPLNSIEDREKIEEEGKAKRKRRVKQINKACRKLYWKNPEKMREKAKLYMRKKYGFKGKDKEENV